MPSIADDLETRADTFTGRVLTLLRTLRREPVTDTLARQLARSSSGVSANYRATRRSRSRAEFIARLAVVVEEADESVHWLEQIRGLAVGESASLDALLDEARQLRAIFARSVGTARRQYLGKTRRRR